MLSPSVQARSPFNVADVVAKLDGSRTVVPESGKAEKTYYPDDTESRKDRSPSGAERENDAEEDQPVAGEQDAAALQPPSSFLEKYFYRHLPESAILALLTLGILLVIDNIF